MIIAGLAAELGHRLSEGSLKPLLQRLMITIMISAIIIIIIIISSSFIIISSIRSISISSIIFISSMCFVLLQYVLVVLALLSFSRAAAASSPAWDCDPEASRWSSACR